MLARQWSRPCELVRAFVFIDKLWSTERGVRDCLALTASGAHKRDDRAAIDVVVVTGVTASVRQYQ